MYPNPYMINAVPKTGLLKGITSLKNIKWASLIEGTQKTLNVINQTIPIIHQVKPIVNNAKTVFKIASSLKEDRKPDFDSSTPNEQTNQNNSSNDTNDTNNIELQNKTNTPIFYI